MGCGASDPHGVQREFDCLCANRTAKYRRRAQLDRRFAGTGQVFQTQPIIEVVALRELAEMVRRATSDIDWQILRMLAEDFTYAEVADRLGMSVGKLKSRVSRARCRLRSSPAGRHIQEALAAR
jgi:DNA-directed RNA polymerase specialized sigma24 family protein